MRITFVTPPFDLSGGQRVIVTYAERLGRRGHQVVVAAPPHRPPGTRDYLRALLGRRPWPGRPAGHIEATAAVDRRVLDRPRPVRAADLPDADVVIATWWETAEWVADLPASKGSKVYFLQHYEAFSHTPGARVDATWRLPFRKVVVAGWLADLSRTRFADPGAAVVPNAVDHELFWAPPRGRQPVPTVGLMYSPVGFKGSDVSLEAVRRAADRVPGLRLRTFGPPVEPHLPLPPGTEHYVHPPQDQLRGIYAGCDAWLFGSRTEGFGLPILEAMACRTPVIGTPAGAAPELLAGGGGVLVRPEDPADMAAAIARVLALPDSDWRAMSDAAHATAARYTWDDATDRFERALYGAAGRPATEPQAVAP